MGYGGRAWQGKDREVSNDKGHGGGHICKGRHGEEQKYG